MTIWQRITGLAGSGSDTPVSSVPAAPRQGDEAASEGRNSVAFTIAVIALGAKMAKADGIVSPVEIDAFHSVFKTSPDDDKRVAQVFELAQRDIAGFETYADQIRTLLGGDPRQLREVLASLFHIATADRALHPGEDSFLKTVAQRFGLSDSVYRHVRAQFVEDPGAPYDVLGLDPAATDAEVKARQRKLVRENHPDLLAGRDVAPESIEQANDKLASINAAYDVIARERGL